MCAREVIDDDAGEEKETYNSEKGALFAGEVKGGLCREFYRPRGGNSRIEKKKDKKGNSQIAGKKGLQF